MNYSNGNELYTTPLCNNAICAREYKDRRGQIAKILKTLLGLSISLTAAIINFQGLTTSLKLHGPLWTS